MARALDAVLNHGEAPGLELLTRIEVLLASPQQAVMRIRHRGCSFRKRMSIISCSGGATRDFIMN